MSTSTIVQVHNTSSNAFETLKVSNSGLAVQDAQLTPLISNNKLAVDIGTLGLTSATDSIRSVQDATDTYAVKQVPEEGGSQYNLSNSQSVVASGANSTNSVSTVGKTRAKIFCEGSNNALTGSYRVDFSDGTNWYKGGVILMQDDGVSGRFGSVDLDVTCVEAVRLFYGEAETISATCLFA